jgi:acyl-CoA thioesterase-2
VPPENLVQSESAANPSGNDGIAQFAEWDIRRVPQDQVTWRPGKASQQQVWFKHKDPLPDDPLLHICALAYMSDLTLLNSAQVTHVEERPHLMVASLDHAMWFMRPFRTDEWLLYDQSSPSAGGGRALTHGKLFNLAGQMVAAVMQEGLTRYERGYHPHER